LAQSKPRINSNNRYGDQSVVDGISCDGLFDLENKCLMGNLADDTAKEQSITREQQDDFAISSYEKSQAAVKAGLFSSEIIPISIKQRGKPDLVIDTDEEIPNCDPARLRALRPAFSPDGTVTAANASTLSDGASCIVLVSAAKLAELKLTPIAEVCSRRFNTRLSDGAMPQENQLVSPLHLHLPFQKL
jgi:acetyl-CoA C-acetyltransferase